MTKEICMNCRHCHFDTEDDDYSCCNPDSDNYALNVGLADSCDEFEEGDD